MSERMISCVIAEPSEDLENIMGLPELRANHNLWYKVSIPVAHFTPP